MGHPWTPSHEDTVEEHGIIILPKSHKDSVEEHEDIPGCLKL